jgi:hypothetical protein
MNEEEASDLSSWDFSDPPRGIFAVLSEAAARNPPGEFQLTEEDYRVLHENVILPAASAFIQSNQHLDLDELCSEAVICLAKSHRAALAVPAFQTGEKSLADREIAKYLRSAVRNHFLGKFTNLSVAGEIRSRLNRISANRAIIHDDVQESYHLQTAIGSEILSQEEIQRLAAELPLRRGRGYSQHFECNLPTCGQLEELLIEVLNSTGKSIFVRDFIDLAITIFDVQKNVEVTLDQPAGDDQIQTQAEMYGESDKAEQAGGVVNVPNSVHYHLPAEVEEAKTKILEVLDGLDGSFRSQEYRPFYHSFFEFWLWEDHPAAKDYKITATRYAQLTGIADSTRLSQKKKFYLGILSLIKRKEDRRVSRSALIAAFASLREEHVDIFRKRWGLSDLTIEEPTHE